MKQKKSSHNSYNNQSYRFGDQPKKKETTVIYLGTTPHVVISDGYLPAHKRLS